VRRGSEKLEERRVKKKSASGGIEARGFSPRDGEEVQSAARVPSGPDDQMTA